MKVKNRDIVKFMNAVDSSLGHKELPVKVSNAITLNYMSLKSAADANDQEAKKILEKYGEKDADGELIVSPEGNIRVVDANAWKRASEELAETEVEVPVTTVNLEDISRCDNVNFNSLTVGEIIALNFMIERQGE